MTHFRAMVISDDYAKALKPYCEHDENYYEPTDHTKDYIGSTIAELKNDGFDIVMNDEEEQKSIRDKQDYARFIGNELIKAIRFYNPNAKYDYYGEQTYFSGNSEENDIVFKKEYEHIRDTDVIKLKYLDFPAMLEKEKGRRRKNYRRYVEVLGHAPNFKTWDMLKKEYGEDFLKDDLTPEPNCGFKSEEEVVAFLERRKNEMEVVGFDDEPKKDEKKTISVEITKNMTALELAEKLIAESKGMWK